MLVIELQELIFSMLSFGLALTQLFLCYTPSSPPLKYKFLFNASAKLVGFGNTSLGMSVNAFPEWFDRMDDPL